MYLLIDNAGTTALVLPETSHRSEGGAYRTLLANFLLRPQTFFSSKEIEKIKGESRKISKKFVGEPDSTKRDCSQILQGWSTETVSSSEMRFTLTHKDEGGWGGGGKTTPGGLPFTQKIFMQPIPENS